MSRWEADDDGEFATVDEEFVGRGAEVMADRNRPGPADALLTAMLREGVDVEDRAAVDAWMAAFNERPFEDRGRLLGLDEADAGPSHDSASGSALPERLDPATFPPIDLRPHDELVDAASRAPMMVQLRGLVTYVADRLPLTDRGNLKLADGRRLIVGRDTGDVMDEWIGDRQFKTPSTTELVGLDFIFAVALQAGLLRLEGKNTEPGPTAPLLTDAPLEAFERVFAAFIKVGPARHIVGEDRYGFGWYAQALDEAIPDWLLGTHVTGNDLPIEFLADKTWNELNEIYELPPLEPRHLEIHRSAVSYQLRRSLTRLERLDVVSVSVSGVRQLRDDRGLRDVASGGSLRLTALGAHLLHRLVAPTATVATVGSLRALPAGELLERLADDPKEVVDAELAAWWDHRDDGLGELVMALHDVSDAALTVAWRGLLLAGTEVAGVIERVDEPRSAAFRHAWMALRAHGTDDAAPPVDDEVLPILVAAREITTAADVCAVLDRLLPTGQAAYLDALWRDADPAAEVVLGTIGGAHHDKRIAKAARKALFKRRSAR
jgi:hypothetical protein